jgi:putative acetyltransferase
MLLNYKDFVIRSWTPSDRAAAADLIATVLAEYGLGWEPTGADRDVLAIETCYSAIGGEFWVVERDRHLIGTAAYYPISRARNAVEIRKMYLLPTARGVGLGRFLLHQLEQTIVDQGFAEIWIETASVLKAAVQLYETSGYQPATGVETLRCDRVYRKILIPPGGPGAAS